MTASPRRQELLDKLEEIAQTHTHWTQQRQYYASQLARAFSSVIPSGLRMLEIGCASGDLLAALQPSLGVGVDLSPAMIALAQERHPQLQFAVCDVERDPLPEGSFDIILLSDVIGLLEDVQQVFSRLHGMLSPEGRLVISTYNFLWEPVLRLAELSGKKTRWPAQNWLSKQDVANILQLSSFDLVRQSKDVLLPVELPVLSRLANQFASKLPAIGELSLVDILVARPLPILTPSKLPGVTVICPCRNERGNIAAAIERTPMMGCATELIFVDGNSNDGTVEEIERCLKTYQGPLQLRLLHQGQGKGKGDAVRKGFAAASHEILMILDADLTVPPEDLPAFYWALVRNKGDFINGVRLVYPMEGEAMRFLNLLGNKFFSSALSWVLEQPIKDSLCGTKVLWKKDYERIAANRHFFGDFDPFGDFDLLFGAARLNMKIVDLPIRYRARVYGETKISRFQHGWELLKMTAFGFRKLRMR